MRHTPLLIAPILCITFVACSGDNGGAKDSSVNPKDSASAGDSASAKDSASVGDSTGPQDSTSAKDTKEPKVGFEILHIKSFNEIITWAGLSTMTHADFQAITLPLGWLKNQPREVDPDEGTFAKSPGASKDGEFVDENHFGYLWRHVATITEANKPLDSAGLLHGNTIIKFHTITFYAGRTLWILVSPEGDQYVRVSRDANRTTDTHPLPSGWKLSKYVTKAKLDIKLPTPILNIRAKNEDSYQGPIPKLNLP